MKTKAFRILSLVLCLILALTAFTACGTKNNESTTQETTTQSVEQIAVLDTITVIMGSSKKTFTVGKEITLDEKGRISNLATRYDTTTFSYNEDGLLFEAASTNNDSGKTATEVWTYENKLLSSCTFTSNNYRSSRDATFNVVTDADGRMIELTENNTYTDSDDGSKSSDVTKYEYIYDESGKVASLTYSKNGEIDHTSTFTYDENGNITVYSSKGSELGEYLRFQFTYKMVDKGTYDLDSQDAVTKFFNWDMLCTYFI